MSLPLWVVGCASNGSSAPIRAIKVVPKSDEVTPPPTVPNTGAYVDPRPNRYGQQRAANRLLEDATTKIELGQYDAAVALLERGLRIDPRNPQIWLVFAKVRLKQDKPALAEQLANKSVALAAGNRTMVAEGWKVILQARSARGDTAGARVAKETLNAYGGD